MKDNKVRTCRWPLYQQDQLGFQLLLPSPCSSSWSFSARVFLSLPLFLSLCFPFNFSSKPCPYPVPSAAQKLCLPYSFRAPSRFSSHGLFIPFFFFSVQLLLVPQKPIWIFNSQSGSDTWLPKSATPGYKLIAKKCFRYIPIWGSTHIYLKSNIKLKNV